MLLLTGAGLLKVRRGWWKFAIVCNGLLGAGMAVVLAGGIPFEAGQGPSLELHGRYVGQLPAPAYIAVSFGLLAVCTFELIVLLRPGVRRLFSPSRQSTPPIGLGMKAGIGVVLALAILVNATALHAYNRWKPVSGSRVSSSERSGWLLPCLHRRDIARGQFWLRRQGHGGRDPHHLST